MRNLPKRKEIKARVRLELSESLPEYELNHELLKLGLRGMKQYPVGPFFADIAFPNIKLAIEYDGQGHKGKEEYDKSRDKYFNDNGWGVYRINEFNDMREAAKGIYKIMLADNPEMKMDFVTEKRRGGFILFKKILEDSRIKKLCQ